MQGKVLIVEDEISTRQIYVAILELAGHQVIEAMDFDHAIALADASIDIALVDIGLPGSKSGIEVLKFFRTHHPDCPVVIVSAGDDKRNVIDALREGAADYLEKPVDLDELPLVVQRWMSIRSLKKENVRLQDFRAMYNALQQSETMFRAIFTASPVPLAINDDQGNIVDLNHAFVQSLGYTTEDIPTLADWWPRAYPDPAYRQQATEAWWANMADAKRTGNAIVPLELDVICKDGSKRVFMVSAASLHGSFSNTHLVMLYDITERKEVEAKANHLAYYDPLTDLPNRRLLMDRLHRALSFSARSRREGAVLIIDLNNFKILNDTLGHDVGDKVLQQVAQRLVSCVRESDTVARLGGDEFVVVLENLSDKAIEAAVQVEAIGEKILAVLKQNFQLDGPEYMGSCSIGVALFKGHQLPKEELIKQADIAMYQAKKSGRDLLCFFDPQMQTSITARITMEKELRKALENRQFQLHYQIQVDSSSRPLGAEALIRWLHPERGMVSPAQFIPLAEETGLILSIGQWVLETACAQIKDWEQDEATRGLVLAVNVSARQFRQADFVTQVQTAVQRHAINAQHLKLELTESMLLENIEDTIETMDALKKIGVLFSLDDFGTGYSSLQYLKRLPLDQLKIDQSFVRDIAVNNSDEAIVRTIIAMAQSLRMDVIAEGVETEEQLRLLLHSGCNHFQGYLFGRPVPIDQFGAAGKD